MHRMCSRVGIGTAAVAKPGRHLELQHPALMKIREFIEGARTQGNVHPRLVANFDQVWSLNYVPAKRVLTKPLGKVGDHPDPLFRSMAMRKLRFNLQSSMDLPLTEPDLLTASEGPYAPSQPEIRGAAQVTPPDSWRCARTLTTLWIDGGVGRGFETISSGTMSEDARERLNDELRHWVHIAPPQRLGVTGSGCTVQYCMMSFDILQSCKCRAFTAACVEF